MKKIFGPLMIILAAVLLRLIPHLPNFAPIGAMALFGGVYLDKKYALVIPLAALFVSDLFLGFHSTMFFVYGSFILTGLIGMYLKKRKNFANIAVASIFSSTLFFIITNFGVWFTGSLYTKNLTGLLNAYIMAIPFFRNTVFGDLVYNTLFFGGYALVLKLIIKPSLVESKTS